MARKEVSLFLKHPGPSHALQRLGHSFLECVVEFKRCSPSEMRTYSPAELHAEYQLKGTATLVDDEIVMQFVPKHAGVHVARIFADTREICRPVAFRVTRNTEVEGLALDKPIAPSRSTSPPPQQARAPALSQDPEYAASLASAPPAMQHRDPMSFGAPAQPHPLYHQQHFGEPIRGFTSDSSLHVRQPESFQRASYISSGGSRPTSMLQDDATFPGDLITNAPGGQSNFAQLHAAMQSGEASYGARKSGAVLDHSSALTPEVFRVLNKDIDVQIARQLRGKKAKKICSICSAKAKFTKSVSLVDEDFCDACFRRQYMLRTAIEHFMVPTIQECSIEVPMNKKRSKFVPARKMLPNVNLRGLEPAEVRHAQHEFRKFDMDGNGWVNRSVLLPLVRASLSHTVSDRELRTLFSSQSLKSTVQTYGLNEREYIHEVEFLGLLAFVARERQRLRTTTNPGSKFTRSDLEMAYAFKGHFSSRPSSSAFPASPVSPVNPTSPTSMHISSFVHPVPGQPMLQQRNSLLMEKSHTDPALSAMNSPLSVAGGIPKSPSMQAQYPYTALYEPPMQPARQISSGLSPTHDSRVSPIGGFSASQNASGFSDLGASLRVGDYPDDLAGEDQEEGEMPSLPPDKDPSARHRTNPLLSKAHPKKQQLMDEFKLTGGKADSWMLY